MTPEKLLTNRTAVLRLVIFDCDGVLVDSEGIANRIVSHEVSALGWQMTPAEADHHFLGMTLPDMVPMIEAKISRSLPDEWSSLLRAEFVRRLAVEVEAIDGAISAIDGVQALGLPWRVASNSSHDEMRVKFARLGLTERMIGRVHSHNDVARGKPAPDVFLAAAAAEGVSASECIVIEDSTTGARAAAAAGMDCLGYAPHGENAHLRAVGAVPFQSMFDLPRLLSFATRAFAEG